MDSVRNLQVKVRTSEDVKATPLLEVPFGTDLDKVVALVGAWGVSTEYGEFRSDALSGQFAIQDGEAFFEVVVNVEGDEA